MEVEPAENVSGTIESIRLDRFRRMHPWPDAKPAVPEFDHGWFQEGSKVLLRERIGPETRLIVELGSWVGQSARWILDNTPAATTLICVDTWKGGPDHAANAGKDSDVARLLPVLHETFLANMWGYRDRLIPVRMPTIDGMREVAQSGLGDLVGVVFVDADHTTDAVYADIAFAANLFPGARILGDDWLWPSVREAVEGYAESRDMRIVVRKNAWAIEKRHPHEE